MSWFKMKTNARIHDRQGRRGLAVVECAVILPVVVLLIMGAVELSRAVMVQHVLQEAAQAACRVYMVEPTTQQNAQDMIDQAMLAAGVTGYTVTFNPLTKPEIDTPMEPVTVTVTVPYNTVGWFSPTYLSGADLVASCTMPADVEADPNTNPIYDPMEDDNVYDGHTRDSDASWGGDDD